MHPCIKLAAALLLALPLGGCEVWWADELCGANGREGTVRQAEYMACMARKADANVQAVAVANRQALAIAATPERAAEKTAEVVSSGAVPPVTVTTEVSPAPVRLPEVSVAPGEVKTVSIAPSTRALTLTVRGVQPPPPVTVRTERPPAPAPQPHRPLSVVPQAPRAAPPGCIMQTEFDAEGNITHQRCMCPVPCR